MTPEELEEKMRKVLAKVGKPQPEIDRVVPFVLNLAVLQTDRARLVFFNQWEDKL